MDRILEKISQLMGTAFYYVVFGPPLGAVAFFFRLDGPFLASIKNGDPFVAKLPLLLIMVPYSYVFGALPALLVGLIMASWELKFSTLPFYLAIAAAVLAMFVCFSMWRSSFWAYIQIHIFAAVIATWILRWWRRVCLRWEESRTSPSP